MARKDEWPSGTLPIVGWVRTGLCTDGASDEEHSNALAKTGACPWCGVTQEELAEAQYFDRLERRDEIMGFYDHMDPPEPDDDDQHYFDGE